MAPEGPSYIGGNGFFEVLTAAVNDIAEHGYDSPERVAYWQLRIKEAAERAGHSQWQMERDLREALGAAYRRLVERGELYKMHPGVARFTINRIKPQLRAELDRRILASADLIRLNRKQSIEKTVQRFAGWATSIPTGGSGAVDRRETKDAIRKSLAGLPFEERRVLVDQGHKLRSSISDIVATQSDAIAAVWHSHFRQAGYDYREDHKERDGQVYLVRGNWAQERGLIKLGPNGYTDEMTKPAEEPFCLPGDVRVPFADGVEIAYRRWYSGDLATVITASGKTLRATPNHPVLTLNGWVSIGSLKEGDHVVEAAGQGVEAPEQHKHDAVPLIAEIFGAVSKLGVAETRRGKGEQFHGDGSEGDIDIVRSAWPLSFGTVASFTQRTYNLGLAEPDHAGSLAGPLDLLGLRGPGAAPRLVGGRGQPLAALDTLARHADFVGLTDASYVAAHAEYAIGYDASRDARGFREAQDTFSRLMSAAQFSVIQRDPSRLGQFLAEVDQPGAMAAPNQHRPHAERSGNVIERLPFRAEASRIAKVQRDRFSGHVYNLQTTDGWYVAEGIITHNCRCWFTYLYALRDLPGDMLTSKGRAELERVRVA